jgi:protein tyrosine phosphatase (PTP) superfamily phosphohydrolase (DUF442 family)
MTMEMSITTLNVPSRVARISLAVFTVLTLSACRSALGREERGLPNFGQVDEGLYRSAQPTREGLLEARSRGVKTVLDLRANHPDAAIVEGTGLECVDQACRAGRIDDEQVARFLAVVTDPAKRPVLVHCQQGRDRTGALVAAYRIAVLGWDREKAIREMEGYGAWPLYQAPKTYLRTFDTKKVLARAQELREHGALETAGAAAR